MATPFGENPFAQKEPNTLLEIGQGLVSGPFTVIDDAIALGNDVLKSAEIVDADFQTRPIFTPQLETGLGRATQEITGFLVGFGLIGKGMRGIRWLNATHKARKAVAAGEEGAYVQVGEFREVSSCGALGSRSDRSSFLELLTEVQLLDAWGQQAFAWGLSK